MANDRRIKFLWAVIVFAAYFVSARLGLSLDAVSGFATVVWPPSGIALTAIFILGYRYWPAIILAAFLVNFVTGAPAPVAFGIGIGNTAEALVGAFILKRFVHFEPSMERVQDIIGLVVFAAPLATAISATIGTMSLLLGNVIETSSVRVTWDAWWIGDMLGFLVAAPLIFTWSTWKEHKYNSRAIMELITLNLILVITTAILFTNSLGLGDEPYNYTYLVFPILITIALRLGQIGSVTSIFIMSLIAVLCTYFSFNPADKVTLSHSLLLLQSFMGISAVTFLTMAAVVSEREKTQRHQQQLKERANVLSKQRLKLVALNRAKNEFVAIASHQLRTPATAVKQYISLLLEGYSGKINKNQKVFLEKAYENNERELLIVDNILRVAKLDLGKLGLRLGSHDISTIIDRACDNLRSTIENKNQTLRFIKPKRKIAATVDSQQLALVVENIIENASHYSENGSEITVRLNKTDARMIEIAVEDQGVGIRAADLKKLFKKFSRINNPLSNSISGSGLGLYFCKKIIDLHKGTIRVKSNQQKGSIFIISLPDRHPAKK